MSFHQISIIGNLGKDPEKRYTPSGKTVTNFPVATNRTYTNTEGEKVKETIWFRISAWGQLGENCTKYLKMGSKVHILGRLNPDKRTGGPRVFERTDGSNGSNYEIVSSQVTFLSPQDDKPGEGEVTEQFTTEEEFPF